MSQAGYTLVEMLAALAIVGLAMTGAAESAHALKVLQDGAVSDLGRDAGLVQARRALERLVAGEGPFRENDPARFVGDARKLRFECGASEPCTGELLATRDEIWLKIRDRHGWSGQVLLPGLQNARFLYADVDGTGRVWPTGIQGRADLTEVILATDLAQGTKPVAVARLWNQQQVRCDYDPIIVDCRDLAP